MTRPIQLLGDRVLVRLIHAEQSAGGIMLPERAKLDDKYREGIVLHAGDKCHDITEGMRVAMDFRGDWLQLDGELLALVKEANILAVLEGV